MSIGDKLLKSAAGAGGLTPSENFKVVTYAGNGTEGRTVTVGFRPDYILIKKTSGSDNWRGLDTTRGLGFINYWNLTNAQDGSASPVYLTVSDTGFATTSNGNSNFNAGGSDYVAFCWKANGGTTSSNSDGSITTTLQTNTDAGFSIIKYTGNGTSGATIGHNLGAVPNMFAVKKLSAGTTNWRVYHTYTDGSPQDYNLEFNGDGAKDNRTEWNDTMPTSTVISLNDHDSVNASGSDYVCYAWTDIAGFSKFGSYAGNGSENGPIVETGFEVGYLMIKRTDSADNWYIVDNVRSTSNPRQAAIFANLADAEYATYGAKTDFLSNGFQIVSTDNSTNANGGNFIYMAFATDPDTEAPTLASSFNIETYTGTGSNKSIAGYGFAPNFLWIKQRSGTEQHYAYDTIRGYSKYLHTNLANAEGTDTSSRLASFDSDGFSLFTDAAVNGSGSTYVAWGWKANDDEPTSYGGPATAIYKMEDNVNDVSGNFNASATAITYSSGKFNKAADFTGGNSQGGSQISVSNDVLGASTTVFSISLWVKCDNSAGEVPLFGNGGTVGGTSGVALYLLNGSLSLTFRTNPSQEFYESIISLNDDNWHHVVMTYGNGPFKLYVDNVLVKSGQSSYYLNSTTPTYDLFFGNRWNRNDNNAVLNGQLDQIRIYDGVINVADVDALYNETASDNDDRLLGGPPKTLVSANANAGFSIVDYNGSGTDGKIPHGLSAAPQVVIIKCTSNGSTNWINYYETIGNDSYLTLNLDNDLDNYTDWISVDATHFSIGAVFGNASTIGRQYIAYCWHSVTGYSKFGTYTGNGGTQSITGLGFKPDFIMFKKTSSDQDWLMVDSLRGGQKELVPNGTAAEYTMTNGVSSFDTDGWTMGANNALNTNSATYIYMAFKKNVASNTTLANSFKAVTYAGTSATHNVTGVGFSPDLVWLKERDGTDSHQLYDTLRGANNVIYSNGTNAQYAGSEFPSFDSDGFTLSNNSSNNESGKNYVAWCWKAGQTWQSNIDGTIASTVNVNTANGFSIVKYHGDSASSATIGHGLSSAPELIITKALNFAGGWATQYNDGSTAFYGLRLNENGANDAANGNVFYANTAPTSSVYTVGGGDEVNDDYDYVSYCFHSVAGYSKIGTYTGTGSSGNDIDVGFQPDFVMMKRTDDTGNWQIFAYDGANKELYPNLSDAEYTSGGNTINSDGFAPEGSSSWNVSSATYIYMAFKAN